jgi:AraC-like DNA-binding protein/mannose-6-phosphate isomerase-like protein (cupin superfamily)
MRQSLQRAYDPKSGVSLATLAYEYPPNWQVPEHAHGSDQLIYATRGVMEIASGQSLWLIPPQFSVWIPAAARHSIRMPGAVSMRTLYIRAGVAQGMPKTCAVFHVTPLLRELIVEAVRIGDLKAKNGLHCALRDLLVACLHDASAIPTFLTLPKDTRALAVANASMAKLSRNPAFSALCTKAGASVRTIERCFRREVGTDFETWRRQARLMKAIELLVAGKSVKQVAFAVGYRRPSAFVAMFRKVFATTPKAWVSAL